MPQGAFIDLPGNERLHYLQMGTGNKLLLAFHGYSNNASLFAGFAKYLGEAYTIISIDLPYHGDSIWGGRVLSISDLELLVTKFVQQHQVSKCSLMGYSLGGRVCLTITEHFPALIDKVVLLSADGMAFNPIYFFTTKTYLGRGLMSRLVKDPGFYINMLNRLKHYKVIPASLHTFVTSHLQSKRSREFLQNVWRVTSNVRPHINRLKGILNNYKIPVFVYAGLYDTIIPVRLAKSFVRGQKLAELNILQAGHRTINAETMQAIAKNLSDK